MTDLVFHLLDIQSKDLRIEAETEEAREVVYESADEEWEDEEEGAGAGAGRRRRRAAPSTNRREFLIHLFGATADGHSVRVDVEGFRPTLYIALPVDKNSRLCVDAIRTYLEKQKVPIAELTFRVIHRKKFYGFTANRLFPFVEITAPSLFLWRNVKNLFLDDKCNPNTKRSLGPLFKSPPEVYEANLDPMLRFLHVQGLNPCGWVSVSGGMERIEDPEATMWVLGSVYTDVKPGVGPAPSAPFLEASWDIECYSATGDFPVPTKTWTDVATLFCEATEGKAFEALETHLTTCATVVNPAKLTEKLATSIVRTTLHRQRTGEDAAATVAAYLKKHFDDLVVLGDPVIQIGTTLARNGLPFERHLFVFPDCAAINGIEVHSFKDEKGMIEGWFKWLVEVNPDNLMGYNVFGFDEKYLWKRAEVLGCVDEGDAMAEVHGLSRLVDTGGLVKLEEKRLSSSALGDNFLYMWSVHGRLQVDMFQYIKRSASLPSYKLDEVTKHYLSGKLKKYREEGGAAGGAGAGASASTGERLLVLELSGAVKDLRSGRALCLLDETGESITNKMVIKEVRGAGVVVVPWPDMNDDPVAMEDLKDAAKWVVVKDDVGPQDIFRLHRGSAADRAIVGKYCLQDCDLVLELYRKLEVFNNSMSMANVCCVPIGYIFTRGQGVKIESLMFRACREKNTLIPVLPSPKDGGEEDSYEGAIVLDPEPGFYSKSPVGVADFASLYPSTIESENISHDSLVWVKDFDYEGRLIGTVWGSEEYDEGSTALAELAAAGTPYSFTDIEFDIWRPDPEDKRKHPVKKKCGLRICRYAQPLDGSKSTLPEIIRGLLAARKAKRVEGERETDPGRKALLDAEQLAYKLTANSLYGQLGSSTFKIRLQALAASVTAYGRKQILFAKSVIERFYGGGADPRCNAKIAYGDTDSLFVEFNPVNPETGERLTGRDARQAVIDLTAEAGHLVTQALAPPHDFEFDKVFDPMLMFSKKRYAGLMFENNADDYVYKYMGIALKRRDNAPVVKTIFGSAMKKLLNDRDIPAATEMVQRMSMDLVEGKVSLGQLTITKSLRAEYADPTRIAHKTLADRIAIRDPGNAPASGDRIGFVYIRPPVGAEAAKLQGDRIETPAYVREKGLLPDYEFYLEHQIQNPVSQMFGLLLEEMPGFKPDMLARAPEDPEKLLVFREGVASEILFRAAYQACSAQTKRAYMSRFFGSEPKAVAKPVALPRLHGTTPKAPATAAGGAGAGASTGTGTTKARQTTLSFASNIVRDELMMSKIMKGQAEKRKAAETKREEEKAAKDIVERKEDAPVAPAAPTDGSLVADTLLMKKLNRKRPPKKKATDAVAGAAAEAEE
jgi:DNA polymerase elongation subunit (family B)